MLTPQVLGTSPPLYAVTNTECTAYIAAMTAKPSRLRIRAIDAMFTRMKARSYWAKLDWLSFPASHSQQAGLINAKNPAQVATIMGAATFVADQGITGSASTGFDTGIDMSTAGGHFTQNSCHMGVWNFSDANNDATSRELTNGTAQIWSNLSETVYVRTNTTDTDTISPVTPHAAMGHRAWSRTSSTAIAIYSDGVNKLNATHTSEAITSVTVTSQSARTICAVHFGGGLTDTEMGNIRSDLGQYFNDTGIIPPFDIFLVIGDSNNHLGVAFDAAIDLPSPLVWAQAITADSGIYRQTKNAPVNFWTGSAYAPYPIHFARDFYIPNGALSNGRAVLLVQNSGGGTGLIADGALWAVGNQLYTQSIDRANAALLANPNCTLKGIVGVIGANDATISADAGAWATALDAMITGFRTNIIGATNVPVLLGGIPPNYLSTGTASAINAKIFDTPNRLAHIGYANPSSPTVLNQTTDGIHFSAEDQRGTLGVPGGMAGRFWTAWQGLT